ncbi:MAG: hypothetical protein GYB68_18370 [Chloroflexi bacterium]|nr:hypothetical protein [Chloroflexota bacterium]
MNLANLIHRLVNDTTFAAQFAAAPQLALETSGYIVDENEFTALMTTLDDDPRTGALAPQAPWAALPPEPGE